MMPGSVERESFDLNTLKSKSKSIESDLENDNKSEFNYLLDFPEIQRPIIAALEKLSKKRDLLEIEYKKELLELEKKYLQLYQPFYLDRAALVNGIRNPLPEEYSDLADIHSIQRISTDDASLGLKNFWLTVLKNHPALCSLIEEADLTVLSFLKDIRVNYLESNPGFELQFHFAENPYFENEMLTKKYYLEYAEDDTDGYIYDHAVASTINWRPGKNLCFKTVTKTQRQRNGPGSRVVKREEPTDSFFHFFYPPSPEDFEDDSDGDVDRLEEDLEADYETGDIFKSEIVPFAIDWFTGKALEHADYSDAYEDDGCEDDSESDDQEVKKVESKSRIINRKVKTDASNEQNCKQQ